MNVLLITQARLGSTRLPGKVLKKIGGRSLLQIHLERLYKAKQVDKIVIATTNKEEDKAINDIAKELGFAVYRGSENDVLDRYYQAAKELSPLWIVRVTADCPLIDPELVDVVIEYAKENDADYCSNNLDERFPDGQDVEVFKFKCLERAWREASMNSEREHVTPYIRKNFNCLNYPLVENFSNVRMTVDEPADFELIKKLVEGLGTDKSWREYVNYIIFNQLGELNSSIKRNEGYIKSLRKDDETI